LQQGTKSLARNGNQQVGGMLDGSLQRCLWINIVRQLEAGQIFRILV
jgi:hypothetical protein